MRHGGDLSPGCTTPEQIAETAIQEDADAVGLSILSAPTDPGPRVASALRTGRWDVVSPSGDDSGRRHSGAEEARVAEVFTPARRPMRSEFGNAPSQGANRPPPSSRTRRRCAAARRWSPAAVPPVSRWPRRRRRPVPAGVFALVAVVAAAPQAASPKRGQLQRRRGSIDVRFTEPFTLVGRSLIPFHVLRSPPPRIAGRAIQVSPADVE